MIGRGSEHIPTPVTEANEHLGRNRLSLVFRYIEDRIALAGKRAENLFVIILAMNKEIIALTGKFEQFIIGIEIGIAGRLTDHYALTLGGAHVLPPRHLEVGKQ